MVLKWSGIVRGAVLLIAASLGIAGCSTVGDLLPGKARVLPLTPIHDRPTGVQRPGSFVWHDLLTTDPAASKAFYGGLFGWRFEERDGYTEIRNGRHKIGGMVEMKPPEEGRPPAIWLPSLSVPDPDRAAAYVREAGGRVIGGPVEMPGRGRGALIADPRGALLVLLRAAGGDPPARKAAIGDWLWNETWTRRPAATLRFYMGLGGYDSSIDGDGYAVLVRDGTWQAGIRQVEADEHPVQWLPVVRVEDPGALLQRVEQLGGEVWVRPGEYDNDDAALVADDQGALLILQRWNRPGGERQ